MDALPRASLPYRLSSQAPTPSTCKTLSQGEQLCCQETPPQQIFRK